MNKMTKGALATGLGVAMLLGGGGTLAVWNDAAGANAGTIVAGNLDLKAGTGSWTNGTGTAVTADYRVVPGDDLTYTQPVMVTLSGDLMKATLTVTGATDSGFYANDVIVGPVTLTDANGGAVSDALTESGTYTASTTFTFKESTDAKSSTNAQIDFGGIGYKLAQVAPQPPAAP